MTTPTDSTPDHRQVGPVTTAATAAAAAVLIVCWLVHLIWSVDVPLEVQGAATVVLVAVAGWLVPPRPDR